MQVQLESLMRAILANNDAAIEANWTPKDWENIGFATYARRRIETVSALRYALASLGATDQLVDLRGIDGQEPVEWEDSLWLNTL